MAILVPEYLQTKTYSAKKDRRVQQAEVMQEGIVDTGYYAVTQRGAGANMSVDVAAGEAWVDGDANVEQGFYHVVNDATVNVTIATANATNPRIDAVVLAVNDSTEIGGSDEFKLEAISGTATAGATLSNLTGKPAIGNTKLLLAYVLVPATATKIENAQIGGLRMPRAGGTGFPAAAAPLAIAGAPAQYAHGRPLSFVPAALGKHSANQNVANLGKVLFNEESYDTDGMHSTSSETSKFICRTPGLYAVIGSVWTSIASPIIRLLVNNTTAVGWASAGSRTQVVSQVYLGYGDYIELQNESGAEFTTNVGAENFTNMKLIWQGP